MQMPGIELVTTGITARNNPEQGIILADDCHKTEISVIEVLTLFEDSDRVYVEWPFHEDEYYAGVFVDHL
jgi:hypothetical protein